jgi:hypothetical protein
MPCGVRSSRRTPSCCSRLRTYRLSDGWGDPQVGGGATEVPVLGSGQSARVSAHDPARLPALVRERAVNVHSPRCL